MVFQDDDLVRRETYVRSFGMIISLIDLIVSIAQPFCKSTEWSAAITRDSPHHAQLLSPPSVQW